MALLAAVLTCSCALPPSQVKRSQATRSLPPQTLTTTQGDTITQSLGQNIRAQTIVLRQNGTESTLTTFSSSAGLMIPPQGIFLDFQNPSADTTLFQVGMQKLWVDFMQIAPSSSLQPGYVSLIARFTDVYGQGNYQYTGVIAEWTSS